MRARLVVVVTPVREDHSRFAERVYQLPVQVFLSETTVEALGAYVVLVAECPPSAGQCRPRAGCGLSAR